MESVVSGVESELGKGGDVGSDGGSNEGDGGGVSEAVKQGGEWSGRVEGGYGSVAERLGMLQCSSLPSAFFIFFSLSLSLSFRSEERRLFLSRACARSSPLFFPYPPVAVERPTGDGRKE